MKPINDHPSIDELVAMLSGELTDGVAAELFEHVSDCAQCQKLCETIWAEASPFRDDGSSEMDDDLAAELEQRFIGQIHRTDLAVSMVSFSSRGFLFVLLGLLQPIAQFLSALVPFSTRSR